jgi:hypothetical protein
MMCGISIKTWLIYVNNRLRAAPDDSGINNFIPVPPIDDKELKYGSSKGDGYD